VGAVGDVRRSLDLLQRLLWGGVGVLDGHQGLFEALQEGGGGELRLLFILFKVVAEVLLRVTFASHGGRQVLRLCHTVGSQLKRLCHTVGSQVKRLCHTVEDKYYVCVTRWAVK
jgi:hypothetical protein